MLFVFATALPWSWATAHQNSPLKAKLRATQTIDQFSASLTETLCAPCLRSTTKSMNRATMTETTKKAHSQAGAMVSTDTPCQRGWSRAEGSCCGSPCGGPA